MVFTFLNVFYLIKSQVLLFTCARDSQSYFILNIGLVSIFLCFSFLASKTHCGAVRGGWGGGGANLQVTFKYANYERLLFVMTIASTCACIENSCVLVYLYRLIL